MDTKLRSLARRANLDDDTILDVLVESLRPHVRTKREFEDVFEDEGSADALAARINLPEKQRAVLLKLQAVKDIFTPNPVLDNLLTAIFLAEVAMLAWSLASMRLLAVFGGLLLLVDAVISRVKHLSGTWGSVFSAWLHRRGFVDHDPLASRIQRKKWSEQSWQLVVHAGFSLAEWIILAREQWYEHTDTCWQPHPAEQVGSHTLGLQAVYITALVRAIHNADTRYTLQSTPLGYRGPCASPR